MAYRPTAEDEALTRPFRTYKGQKIDIRWFGGWLTPEGTYHPIDYKNGITHETIAEQYGRMIGGSGSISTRPPIMRIFDIAGWMRITYLEESSFCVELKGDLVGNTSSISGLSKAEVFVHNHRRQSHLLRFAKRFTGFDGYFINNAQYDSHRKFLAAIRSNDVSPTGSTLVSRILNLTGLKR